MTARDIERQALTLFDELADVAEHERLAWLDERSDGNPALRSRVIALLTAERQIAIPTGGAWQLGFDAPPPDQVGAYRIVERIGEGGMGTVYRGERVRGDFAHVAAIKVIKPGLLSEPLVERFRRERQTLAQLEHPNIARLYDGGETEDGAPYIVMQYVEGPPLSRWVADHAPDAATRLALFAAICDAAACAHRNLIVHRDITPANILVTADGIPKLIDFGIARPPASTEANEAPAIPSLSLTPGYAAPERLTSSSVTTGADIYSLGKLLGWLLPQADPELRAIIGRATATDPQARYPTAEALGEDVEAWRKKKPVAAFAGGKRYIARKFVARNRTAVALASAALALLIAALLITLGAQRREEMARIEAEQRFAQTRSIARALLFDIFEDISRLPGSTHARDRLARVATTYLDALAGSPGATPDLRAEAGRGFVRLAQVVGSGTTGHLGNLDAGNRFLARAERILVPLHAANPGDLPTRDAYSALLVEQSGANLVNNNAPKTGREQAVRAQAVLGDLARTTPDLAARTLLAIRQEGDSHAWEGHYADAERVHRRAEAFFTTLPLGLQTNVAVASARAANLRSMAEAMHRQKKASETRVLLDRVVAMQRTLAARNPGDPEATRQLISALQYRAIVHRTNYRDAEARASIFEASRRAEAFRDRDPADAGALRLYALVKEVEAQVLADMGKKQESFAVGEQSVGAFRRLVAMGGDVPGALRSLAAALRTHGGNTYTGRDYAGACRIWDDDLKVFDELERRGALLELDRNRGRKQILDFVQRGCHPPRAGLAL